MKTPIEKAYEQAAGKLSEVRERSIADVSRWAYTEFEIWSWWKSRSWPERLESLPSSDGACYACGFDERNRPIVLYYFDSETVYEPSTRRTPLKTIWCEEFIAHREDGFEILRYVRGKLERISNLKFEARLLVEDKSVVQGVYQHTMIYYAGSKKTLQRSLNNKGQPFFEIQFGPHGNQTFFRVRRDGSRSQLGRPLPKGITVKSLKEIVRNRLLELIPALVSAAGILEPIYCIALAYDDENNGSLPPTIGIGLDSERQRWMKEHGKRAKQFVWNPAEFHHYEKSHTQLWDDALEEACDYLNDKWAEASSAAGAVSLLTETAAELNRANWPASVKRTDDFVVYAIGYEGTGFRKSLRAGLTPEKLSLLKAQDLV